MRARSKVLLIGLDAAEISCIEKWAAEGHLPNLRRLAERGGLTRLSSPAAEFPDAVWPSLYTSLNAAKLGKYYYIQPKHGAMSLGLVDQAPSHGEQFWRTASEAGRRCAVVDAPETDLGPPVNGIQVANWGAHGTRCRPASHPPDLLQQLIRRHGPYPIHSCDNHGLSPAEYRKLREHLIEGARLRTELLLDLMAKGDWDLFFGTYAETHCSGHQFWHLQDPCHPSYDPEDLHDLRDSMRETYREVDRGIGRLIEAAGEDTHVMIFSAHGMRAQYHGRDLLPILLKMWGMAEARNIEPDAARERSVVWKKSLLRRLRNKVPIQWQYAVKKMLPSKIENAIVCLVMGAEKGLVAQGSEYHDLRDWLVVRLTELVNPATGGFAVAKVSRIHDMYQGAYLNLLPDLTVFWSQEAPIHELYSPGYGTVAGSHDDLRTGGHTAEGFLILCSSAAHLGETCGASGKDVAPTVLDLLDVPIPAAVEGRSLAVRTAS
jgi:predicted AlkP superfamily phosphohydrolase/phosphomutase